MEESNKAVVREFVARIGARDLEGATELVAPGWRLHLSSGATATAATLHETLKPIFDGFPDLTPKIHQQVAEGEVVMSYLTLVGTHDGAFQGIAATGKPIEVQVVRVDRMAEERIAESTVVMDLAAALRQAGITT